MSKEGWKRLLHALRDARVIGWIADDRTSYFGCLKSVCASTRHFWRREMAGLPEAVVLDPRPLAECWPLREGAT